MNTQIQKYDSDLIFLAINQSPMLSVPGLQAAN